MVNVSVPPSVTAVALLIANEGGSTSLSMIADAYFQPPGDADLIF
jgi:hypothetical protein